MGARKNRRALPRARPFFLAPIYATQALGKDAGEKHAR